MTKEKFFIFNGKIYNYFYHEYNNTQINERCVEVPIIWDIVCSHSEKNILEIGNTLGYYFDVKHDVVDKYDNSKSSIINKDIVDFSSQKKYDLIVSISTFEHIGIDEKEEKDENKIIRAIENVRSLLSKTGKAYITIPLGYNIAHDRRLLTEKIGFDELYFLSRESAEINLWKQVKKEDLRVEYKWPYDYIFWLAICKIDNSEYVTN